MFNINRLSPLGPPQHLIEPPHVQVKIKSYPIASMGPSLVSAAIQVSYNKPFEVLCCGVNELRGELETR